MSCRLYLSQCLLHSPAGPRFRLSARSLHVSSPSYNSKWKLPKLFSGKTEENTPQLDVESVENEFDSYDKEMEEYNREAQLMELKGKRNKSKLSASDRQMLNGLAPDYGLKLQYGRIHHSKEYRRSMLAQYGSDQTNVDPAMSWPTDEELRLASDWERLYQDTPLTQQIAQVKTDIQQRKADRIAREKVIEANLSKMDSQIKQWKQRVNTKNKQAEMERERREKVLAELREEFGYNVNPQDNYMKERIAEREKALIKEEKEAKKAIKKEKFAAGK